MAPPATPRTAARRAKKASPHLPFNARPKDVGTRTGLPMPINVGRDSMGFENASEFFMSPNGTEAPGTSNTIRTFGGTATSLLKSTTRSTRIGVGSGADIQTPAPAGKKGRFQQLAGGSDEDDISLGEDLLNDGDDILDHRLSSPAPWYATNEPPTVSLPTPSRVPAPSRTAGFDDLPTPQRTPQRVTASLRRTSRIGVGKGTQPTPSRTAARVDPSPAKSTASSNQHMDALDLELADMDEDDAAPSGIDMDMSRIAPPSPPVRSPNKRMRKSNATSVGGDLREMDDDHRLSLGRIKSRERIVDPDDEDDDAHVSGAADFSFGAEDAPVPMDLDNDDQFDVGGGGFGDIAQDMTDGDISLEAAAIARENGKGDEDEGEEEDEEVEPLCRPVKAKPKTTARSRATSSQARNTKQAERAERRRMRLSRVGVEDENQYVGDFVMRRSGRTHMAPLEYWRGEKVAYGRGHGLTEVKEVIRLQPEVRPSLGSKRKAGRARSQSEKPRQQVVEDKENFEGWDDNTDPVGHVTEFATGKDIQRRIAFTKDHLEPKQVAGSEFKYQKVFGEDQFIASGVVYIPVGGSKPSKQSKDNSYVFYVIAGAVQVTVTKTSFVMVPGGMFMVPRGNEYEISNVSQETEAELFFAQARKIRMNEADETAFERLQAQVRARSASLAASERPASSSRGATREASDDDEAEEEVEEVAPKGQKGRRRVKA